MEERCNLLLLLVSLSLLFFSCQKDEDPFKVEKISFEHPQVGQKSLYLLLKGEDYKSNHNFNFSYVNDTLAAEIVAKNEKGYLVKEYLTPGSASLNGENNVAFADSAIYYYLDFQGDLLFLHQVQERLTSRIYFFQFSNEQFLLLAGRRELQVGIKGWKTDLPYSTDKIDAFTSNMELLNAQYDTLNIAIDNRPLKTREPGFTHIFSKKYGLVRSSHYSWYTSKGFGWDLLP